MDEIALV